MKLGGMKMKVYWDEKFETMPLEQMQVFQLDKLRQTVAWVKERIPFYRKALEEKGVGPDDLRSLDDIRHLPLTVKTDLRDNYPFGLCAVPVEELVRIHASSGTTGKPITGPYTAEDLENRCDDHSQFLRHDRAAGQYHARLRLDRSVRHPLLCPDHRRESRRDGC
jgi:phenylacetate-coenzyme A ligase PaaK-like adenylate-forming protein